MRLFLTGCESWNGLIVSALRARVEGLRLAPREALLVELLQRVLRRDDAILGPCRDPVP